MMDVTLLLKLVELKKQEIDDYKNDFNTLTEIVSGLEAKFKSQQTLIDGFLEEYINNQHYNSSATNIISGRAYLQSLNLKNNAIEQSKLDAEKQKDSAFESLKDSVIELKKLTKVIEKTRKTYLEDSNKKTLLIDDTLELYRHNKKA